MTKQRVKLLAVAIGVCAIVVACDDPFDAFLRDVPILPLEATIFDLTNGRLQDPPAYDVIREVSVRIDQSNQWDFLFRIVAGAPELLPFAAVTDSTTDSGLILATQTFDGVLEAPNGGYTLSTPVAVAVGDVFVVRSRTDTSQPLSCSRFAKIEVLDIDLAVGTLTFQLLGNPNCGDRVLEAGTRGSF